MALANSAQIASRRRFDEEHSAPVKNAPSSFYRGDLWRAGLLGARLLPRGILERTAVGLSLAYHNRKKDRREIVVNNLLPAVGFDLVEARRVCRSLFRNFGLKLADLWRYEAGCETADPRVTEPDWSMFESARGGGRGVLLVTCHIGNWEFGAPFLRKRGVSLQVITQAEPEDSLTEMRKKSRARWGIETIVIGQNPFAFVEVIRRLDQGAAVALLVDRPPAQSAIPVELFGRPFSASIAAAELARASGCAILPVCLPRDERGYSVQMLPPVQYDRAGLGSRQARANFTQDLLRRFEPFIQRHLDQWYHFVPLWRE